MRGGKIFFVGEKEGELDPMSETPFAQENILQELLAKYPDLIPGDQIDPENPRRWMLVARELSIPDGYTDAGKFSLDHLFLDQDGIPTLVECKRAADTRIRREVVAQMLDYAANGTKYLAMERIRQSAAETLKKSNLSLDEVVKNLIEAKDTTEVEDFWDLVEQNLRKGNIRLLFISDTIPQDLRRLIEFLNEQMTDTEVLAVEIKHFVGENKKAIVSRVIGFTETARSVKAKGRAGSKTTPDEFLSKCEPVAATFFKKVLSEADKRSQTIHWGISGFSAGVALSSTDRRAPVFYGYPPDRVEIWPGYLEYLNVDSAEIDRIKKRLLSTGVFRESQKALLVRISNKNIEQLDKAYEDWLSTLQRLLESQ